MEEDTKGIENRCKETYPRPKEIQNHQFTNQAAGRNS